MAGFALSAFSDEIDSDLRIQMKVLGIHNINYMEIRGVNGENVVKYTLKEVQDIKRQLDASGIRVSAIGSPIGKIGIEDDFDSHLKLLEHTLKVAKILDTKYIRIFSFFIPEGEAPSMYRSEVIRRMKEMVKITEGTDIVLLHENEKNIYGDSPERCLDILNEVNSSQLKATFDPANFVQCNRNPFPEAFMMLEDHIEYIHIKDARYSVNNNVPAGEGDGKIEEIIRILNKKRYNGFLTLEPHLSTFAGLQALEPHSGISEDISGDGVEKFAIAVGALKKVIAKAMI